MIFFCVVEHRDGKEKHQKQYNVCRYAYTEVQDTAEIGREGTTPHKCQYYHDEHSTGWVRNMPEWILAGVKNVCVTVVNPKSEVLHFRSYYSGGFSNIRKFVVIGSVRRFYGHFLVLKVHYWFNIA
jgi:hypothetical protein